MRIGVSRVLRKINIWTRKVSRNKKSLNYRFSSENLVKYLGYLSRMRAFAFSTFKGCDWNLCKKVLITFMI